VIELLQEVIAARQAASDAIAEAERITQAAADAERRLIEQMDTLGLEDLTIKGVRVQVKTKSNARSVAARDAVVKALYDAGLSEMVYESWSPSSVSAMFRRGEAPPSLCKVFEVNESRELKVKLPLTEEVWAG
jgi:hypothetical protein